MKNNRSLVHLLVLLMALVFSSGGASRVEAQDESGGIRQQMTPEEFKAAGLQKLTPQELAKLNAWIHGDREKAVETAVTATEKKAAQRAEKEKKSLIVSRIDGVWNGIARGGVIQLEDGSKWQLANKDEHYGGSADHPAVAVWKAGIFGWKMRVSRLAEFYVNPVK
jgi:hypothetical protein